MAGLVVVLAFVSQGTSLSDDADARVDIALAGHKSVDAVREEIISEATSSWRATRVAESTESEREATVTFALPGTSLDGFINALRHRPDARSVNVSLEVDPDQLEPPKLSTDQRGQAKGPEPVTVSVNLDRKGPLGPMVTFIGLLIVVTLVVLAFGVAWRRFRPGDRRDDEGDEAIDPVPPGVGRQRRWISGT